MASRYKPIEILHMRYYDFNELEYPYVEIFCDGPMKGYYEIKRDADITSTTINIRSGMVYEAFTGNRWQPIDRYIFEREIAKINLYRSAIDLPSIVMPRDIRGWR